MRIAIDARLYGLQHRGLGRYLYELLPALAALDRQTDYILLVDPKATLPKLPPNFHTVPAPWRVYSWGEQVKLPALLWRLKPDLVHFPHFAGPIFRPRPYVITIHDLILHHHPTERATTLPPPLYWVKLLGYRLVVRSALWRARRIMAVSQTTGQDLVHFYPWVQSKISVVPLAPGRKVDGVPLQLPSKYLLTVGAAYPHKNLELVLRAMVELSRQRPGLKLVVVGRNDVFMERLKHTSQELKLEEHVIFWGEASEAELATLYARAAAYLFPSLSEGFGLAPVEALSYGTAVVASDIPVLREVLGQGAVFINPYQLSSLTEGISRVLQPEVRQAVVQAGAEVVKRFSWTKTARQTLACYRDILKP